MDPPLTPSDLLVQRDAGSPNLWDRLLAGMTKQRLQPAEPSRGETLDADEVVFLICVEANPLEVQAHLLCASLRRFGGRYKDAPIVAVSPRPALALSPTSQAALEALGVTYVSMPLNETGSPYGTINRIVTGAWAEANLPQPYLVVLDTDMIFTAEPCFLRADVGVRPVDMKGSATGGEGDPLDDYWTRLCGFAGIAPSTLPPLETAIDRIAIRASYNGGFMVVRRDLGVLRRTRDIFFASLEENMRPLAGSGVNVFASTGLVGVEASEWWGSSQAALSIAIWSLTLDVRLYDNRYNIPAHLLRDRSWPLPAGYEPVLLHHHYPLEREYHDPLLGTMRKLACSQAVLEWTQAQLAGLTLR